MKYTKRQIKEAIAYWLDRLHESDMETDLPALPGEDDELEPSRYGSGLQTAKDTLGDFLQKAETAIRSAGVKVYGGKICWQDGESLDEIMVDIVGEMLDIIENEGDKDGAKGVVMFSQLDDGDVLHSLGSDVLSRKKLDCLDEIINLLNDDY